MGPALEALAERTGTVNDLAVSLRLDFAYESGREPTRLAPSLETTVYRLVQEALTNVVKHARAARVEIAVAETSEHVEITVSDDGVGFDPEASAAGFGLIGMRERASLMEGRLSVESRAGGGTTISCRLPVERARPTLSVVDAATG